MIIKLIGIYTLFVLHGVPSNGSGDARSITLFKIQFKPVLQLIVSTSFPGFSTCWDTINVFQFVNRVNFKNIKWRMEN